MYDALVRYVTAAMVVEDSSESGGGVVFEGEDFAFVRLTSSGVQFVAAGDAAIGRQIVDSLP
jgi:hypothetical protein